MGRHDPPTPLYMLPVVLAKIPVGIAGVVIEEAACMWRDYKMGAFAGKGRAGCADGIHCSEERGIPARYRLLLELAADLDRSSGGALSALGIPAFYSAGKPEGIRVHYTDCELGDYHAKELADALEAHIDSLMHMPLAEKGRLAGILEHADIPNPRKLCSGLPQDARSSLSDGCLEYEVVLRRLINNNAAKQYLDDFLKKAYAFAANAASWLGMRSSDLLAACLMREKRIVEAMAKSPGHFSLLGKVAIYEDNEQGRKTERLPIVAIPGAEGLHELHQWEQRHRKEYFCENGQ